MSRPHGVYFKRSLPHFACSLPGHFLSPMSLALVRAAGSFAQNYFLYLRDPDKVPIPVPPSDFSTFLLSELKRICEQIFAASKNTRERSEPDRQMRSHSRPDAVDWDYEGYCRRTGEANDGRVQSREEGIARDYPTTPLAVKTPTRINDKYGRPLAYILPEALSEECQVKRFSGLLPLQS